MSNQTILLVEDNQDDEILTLRAFREARISNGVIVVRDGAEALEYLFAEGRYVGCDLPGLVLLDLNLPKISGLDVLGRLRAKPRTRLVPVVILTTSVEPSDVTRGWQEGCQGYIRKPVDFDQFADCLKQVELYWFVLNELPPRH